MSKLTIGGTGGTTVPGQEEAKAARAARKAERDALLADESQSLIYSKETLITDRGPEYLQQKVRFHKKDEINPYADEQDARHALDWRTKRLIAMLAVLVVVFFFAATLPTNIFSQIYRVDHSIGTLIKEFNEQVTGFFGVFMGKESMYASHVWEVVAAVFAGAALGLSGGVYQGALKNALASPSTLGVMQGGTLGIIIYGILMYNGSFTGKVSEYNALLESMTKWEYFCEIYGQYAASLVGCFAVVSMILLIAHVAGHGKITNVTLVIAGQVFASVISVVINWIKYYLIATSADADLVELLSSAQSSSFTGTYTWFTTMVLFVLPLCVLMFVVFRMSDRLTLLAFNDEEARSMGLSVTFQRNLMVGVCTAMTALVVSFCGAIGFVGFMVPHIARNWVGPNFKYLLPACALCGACLVCASNYFSLLGLSWLPQGSAGQFVSIIGCISFVVVALRSRGGSNGVWN